MQSCVLPVFVSHWWELICVVLCACICVVFVGTNVCSPVCFLYLCCVGGN